MRSRFLTHLWHKVLDVTWSNYFSVLEEVELAYTYGRIDNNEYSEMKKFLKNYSDTFMDWRNRND